MDREEPVQIALGLGSNLGDREMNIRAAVRLLERDAVTGARCSACVESEPEDCPPGTADFLNAVLVAETRLAADALLAACLNIEARLGRIRSDAHGACRDRCVDIDILLYGSEKIDTETLTVPHPRLMRRSFVLAPLAEVAPDWVLGDRGTAADYLLLLRA